MDDLDTLVHDLSRAGLLAGIRVVPVVHRAANNIVRDARGNAPQSAVIRYYPDTITYDVEIAAEAIIAEIGPDREKNGQAKLANIFEYGTSKLPPRPHLGPALDREAPRFEQYVEEIAERLL